MVHVQGKHSSRKTNWSGTRHKTCITVLSGRRYALGPVRVICRRQQGNRSIGLRYQRLLQRTENLHEPDQNRWRVSVGILQRRFYMPNRQGWGPRRRTPNHQGCSGSDPGITRAGSAVPNWPRVPRPHESIHGRWLSLGTIGKRRRRRLIWGSHV